VTEIKGLNLFSKNLILEQSAIRWSHLIAAFCGKNKNLESFATQFDRE